MKHCRYSNANGSELGNEPKYPTRKAMHFHCKMTGSQYHSWAQPWQKSWRGLQVRWIPIPFLFLTHPFPNSSYCSIPVSPIPFPAPLFLSSLIRLGHIGKHYKLTTLSSEIMTARCNSQRGLNRPTVDPHDLQSWRGVATCPMDSMGWLHLWCHSS